MALTFNSPRIPNGNGDALWKGTDQSKFNQCDCCPYGYHIDLDFVRFCETVTNRNDASLNKERRRERRRQRQSVEVLLGLTSQSFWNLEQQLPKIPQEPVVSSEPPDPSKTSDLVRDALHKAVQDFEDTLERTHKTPGGQPPDHLQDGFTDVPVEAASSGDTSLSSMSAVSSPLTSHEVDNEGAMSSAAHEALLQDFDVASIGSATSGHSHAALQNIRQQMALSLERMRDLEEQVKLIPILQVQLSVAKEEKRKISLVMQANKLEQSKRSENECYTLDTTQSSSSYDTLSGIENSTIHNPEEVKTIKFSNLNKKHVSTNTDPSIVKQTSQLPNGECQTFVPTASWLGLRQMETRTENYRKVSLSSIPSEVMFREHLLPQQVSTPADNKRESERNITSISFLSPPAKEWKTEKTFDCDESNLAKRSNPPSLHSVFHKSAATCLEEKQEERCRVSRVDTTTGNVNQNGSLTRSSRSLHRTSSPRRRSRSVSADRTVELAKACASNLHFLEKIPVQATIRRQKPVRNVETQTVNKFTTRDVGIGTYDAKNNLQSLESPPTILAKEVDNSQSSKSQTINSSKEAKKAFIIFLKHIYGHDLSKKNEQLHIDFFMKQMNALSDDHWSEEHVVKKSAGTQVSIQAKSVGLQISPNVVLKSEAMVQVGPKVRSVEVNAVVEQKCVSTGELDVKDPVCHFCNSKTGGVQAVEIVDNKRRNVNIAITSPKGSKTTPHTVSIHVQTVKQKEPLNHGELNTNVPEKSKAKFKIGSETELGNAKQEQDKNYSAVTSDSITSTQDSDSSVTRPKNPKIFVRQDTYTKIDLPQEVASKDELFIAADVSGKNLSSPSDFSSDHCSEEWERSPSGPSVTPSIVKLNGSQNESKTILASKDGNSLVSSAPIARTYKPIPSKSSPLAEGSTIPCNDTTTTSTTSISDINVKKSSAFSSLQSPLSSEKIKPVQDGNIKDTTAVKLKNISFVQKSKVDDCQPAPQLPPSTQNTDLNTGVIDSTETVFRSSSRFESNIPSSIPVPYKESVKPTALVNPSYTGIDSGLSNLSIKDLGGSSTSTSSIGDRPSTSKSLSTNFSHLEEGNGEFSPLHPIRDDLLNLSSAERPTRVEPSRTMKAALKVVNDALLKSSLSNSALSGGREFATTSTSNALDMIRREWFIISSTREADPNIVEDYLDYFEELSSELLKHVVNMTDKAGNTAMHYALSTGNFDVVSILLDSKVCDINLPNSAGYTAVMLLSLAKIRSETDRRVLQRFLGYADVNIRAALNGQTALMLAVSQNRLDMVQLLVEGGADLNIQDIDGSTALMCAAEHGLVSMVQYLISQPDADQTIKDLDGSTALDIALDAGHKDVGILLYAHKHFSRNNSPYSSLRGRRSKSATPKPGTTTASGSTPPPRTTPSSPLPNRVRRTQQ